MVTDYATSPDGRDRFWYGTALDRRPGSSGLRGVRISAVRFADDGVVAHYDEPGQCRRGLRGGALAWPSAPTRRPRRRWASTPTPSHPTAACATSTSSTCRRLSGRPDTTSGLRPDGAHDLRNRADPRGTRAIAPHRESAATSSSVTGPCPRLPLANLLDVSSSGRGSAIGVLRLIADDGDELPGRPFLRPALGRLEAVASPGCPSGFLAAPVGEALPRHFFEQLDVLGVEATGWKPLALLPAPAARRALALAVVSARASGAVRTWPREAGRRRRTTCESTWWRTPSRVGWTVTVLPGDLGDQSGPHPRDDRRCGRASPGGGRAGRGSGRRAPAPR